MHNFHNYLNLVFNLVQFSKFSPNIKKRPYPIQQPESVTSRTNPTVLSTPFALQ